MNGVLQAEQRLARLKALQARVAAEILDVEREIKEGRRRNISNRPPAKIVREWAIREGFTLGARGRVPAEVYDQYAIAHRLVAAS